MTNKLHVLFLCGWYPSRVLPNNGDFIQRHAEAVNTKHTVSVLHIITDPNLKTSIETSFEVVNNVQTHIAYIKPAKNNFKKASLFYKAFKLLLNKIDFFDLVHVNKLYPFGVLALFLKFFYKKPFIVTEHWTGYHSPDKYDIAFTEVKLSKLIAKSASFICPVSNDLKNSMLALKLHGEYTIVPNVVNTDNFTTTEKKMNAFKVLHISNMLDKHKNVSGIISTFNLFLKHLPHAELILVGEKSIQYKTLTDTLNLSDSVTFIPHIPHKDVIKEMQNAHVFVLFSNYENLPCVILESFACGTPVISTDVGGIREFFPENFGYLIQKGNQNDFLEKLIAIEKQYSFNGNDMHQYAVANFSVNKIAKMFSNLYRAALT